MGVGVDVAMRPGFFANPRDVVKFWLRGARRPGSGSAEQALEQREAVSFFL